MQIPIDRADRVIAAFPYRDIIIVITESGAVFEITIKENAMDDRIQIQMR